MKKQTAMALAAVFAMSVAGTALAAPANPFVDVPAKHWAYDSINKLVQAGVISGYGDGTFRGDKTLTRYEVAVIVGKAMANSDKADAEAKKAIEALKAEFGSELSNLGVRVDNLEKKTDNVKITGAIRARYDNNEVDNDTTVKQKFRSRIMINGQINDQWTYTGRLQNTHDFRTAGTGADNDYDSANKSKDEHEIDLNWAYVSGMVGKVGVTLGRFDATAAYGIAFDDTVDAAMFSFGNKLKVDLLAGKQDYTSKNSKDTTYIANLGYAFSDKLNAKGAYINVDTENGDDTRLYEVGMDYKLTPTLAVKGIYIKSNDETQDKGYLVGFDYKGANIKNVGSFGAYANYRNLEKNAEISTTLEVAQVKGAGGKGYEVGFQYVPFKNGKWTTSYNDLKDTVNKDVKGKYLRTQMEFYF